MKAAIVVAAIGATLAAVEGVLLIALGNLAGLAENPEGEAAATDGYVVLALGAIVLAAVFVARRWPFILAATSTATAAAGFLVDNPLWVFAAASLLAAAALVLISNRGGRRLADQNGNPGRAPTSPRWPP